MDRNNEREEGLLKSLRLTINREAAKRRTNGTLLISDILIFAVAFVFSRCHMAFGAYPLAIAFISVLKSGVFMGTLGSVCGAFSLGGVGLIYAVISLVTLFLRMIISGGTRGERRLFSESLPLKISSAGVAALVGGTYQMLLDGFSTKSLLFALFGISLSCGFAFLFSGIYLADISLSDVLFSKKTIFTRKSFKNEKERLDLILYTASILGFIYVIGIALSQYELFGISASYVFSSFITLFVAKRLGAVRAMAVGFLSSLPINGIYAVSFAFAGLGAGLFFSFGSYYAIIAATVLLSLYGYYVGGVEGIVSTVPEFVLASVCFLPFIRYLSKEKEETQAVRERKASERMVNVASLSYKNKGIRKTQQNALGTVKSLSKILLSAGKNEGVLEYDDYRDGVVHSVREHCLSCPSFEACVAQSPAPCAENIDQIAKKLTRKDRLFVEDTALFPRYCSHKSSLYDRVIKSASELEDKAKKNCRMAIRSKDYELVYKTLDESFKKSEDELCLNPKQSEEVEQVLCELGISEPSAKVFGSRRRHIIAAGVDEGGKISTSRELKDALERRLKARVSEGEFYKKDNYILSEFDELEKYAPSLGMSTLQKDKETANGDSLVSFKSEDGRFSVLLSDGEGSGEEAKETSSLVCDYLSSALSSPISKSTAISALNHILKSRDSERSATVDLFELDLYTGEGVFYKCGAVSSYIKREDSIFKVRSQSAPIGLLSSIDAESIRVDVKSGDTVILLSDGILPENEDGTWFLELVSHSRVRDASEYADMIMNAAKKKNSTIDDMSVAVIKITDAK